MGENPNRPSSSIGRFARGVAALRGSIRASVLPYRGFYRWGIWFVNRLFDHNLSLGAGKVPGLFPRLPAFITISSTTGSPHRFRDFEMTIVERVLFLRYCSVFSPPGRLIYTLRCLGLPYIILFGEWA